MLILFYEKMGLVEMSKSALEDAKYIGTEECLHLYKMTWNPKITADLVKSSENTRKLKYPIKKVDLPSR